MHRRPQDYEFFKRLNPAVIKLMDAGANDYQWVRDNLPDSFVIARDWAMSEQHDDMLRDPIGTGKRHAQEWNQHAARLGFDRAKTLILGINEPKIWDAGVAEALRLYTIAMCDKATELGLRVGAMQLSVGWPANNGPDTPPNWSPWHGVEAAILRNRGALCFHEYWADGGPNENWGWWAGRALKCPWNVSIVISECGVDMYVKDASVAHASRGWHGRMEPKRYAMELAEYAGRMSADPRFVGDTVFAADYANAEWWSFDIEPAYQAILETPAPTTTHLPSIGTGPTQPPIPPQGALTPSPVAGQQGKRLIQAAQGVITQRWGESPKEYARFGIPGHNGLDIANSAGTPILSVADGVVAFVGTDTDYGIYCRITHPQLGLDSFYAHLQAAMVTAGERVTQGKQIGAMGTTGHSTGNHLHLEFRLSNGDSYVELSGGYGKGRVDPLIVYHLLNHMSAIVQPAPNDLRSVVTNAAIEFGINPDLYHRLVEAESSYRPDVVSDWGAIGLAQVMPATFAEHAPSIGATNIYNPRDNARVGAAYLRWLIDYLNGDVYKALLAYNWGVGRVVGGRTPPVETVEYANKILKGI